MTTLLACVIVCLIGSAVLGTNGIAQLMQLRAASNALANDTMATMARIAALDEARELLSSNDRHLEAIARRELGLVYRDEVVYRFRRMGDPAP